MASGSIERVTRRGQLGWTKRVRLEVNVGAALVGRYRDGLRRVLCDGTKPWEKREGGPAVQAWEANELFEQTYAYPHYRKSK